MYREKVDSFEAFPLLDVEGQQLQSVFSCLERFEQVQAAFFEGCDNYANGGQVDSFQLSQLGEMLHETCMDYAKTIFSIDADPNYKIEELRSFIIFEDRMRTDKFKGLTGIRFWSWQYSNSFSSPCFVREQLQTCYDYTQSDDEFLDAIHQYFADFFKQDLAVFAGCFNAS